MSALGTGHTKHVNVPSENTFAEMAFSISH